MEAPAGNSKGGSNAPSREEFNTAIGDLSAKLESLMMTMSQLVHGTAPTATGDGGESRGEGHTAPGAEQERLDQAPNTGGASDLQRHRSASSVGVVSRERTASVLFAETRATSSNNAPSRSARNVGGRDTTSRNVPLRWSLLGPW